MKNILPFSIFGSIICSFFILVGIYPYRPDSIITWLILFLISLPITIAAESFGEKLLENDYISKHGSFFRMTYAVIVIILFVGAITLLLDKLKPYLGTWST